MKGESAQVSVIGALGAHAFQSKFITALRQLENEDQRACAKESHSVDIQCKQKKANGGMADERRRQKNSLLLLFLMARREFVNLPKLYAVFIFRIHVEQLPVNPGRHNASVSLDGTLNNNVISHIFIPGH